MRVLAFLTALSLASLAVMLALPTRDALAWGLSPPVGPTGVISCSGDERATLDPQKAALAGSRWHVGASFGVFGSALTFGEGASDVLIERRAVSASVDYRLGAASTLSLGSGAGIGGLLIMNGARHEISPGWLLTGAYSYRLLDGRGAAPFLLLGLSFGGSGASSRAVPLQGAMNTSPVSLYAFDIRAGVTVGKTFWNVLSPYAALRAFGGPVIWNIGGQTRSGTDKGHFQAAAGLVASLPRGVDLYAEVAPAFERAVTVGGGVGF